MTPELKETSWTKIKEYAQTGQHANINMYERVENYAHVSHHWKGRKLCTCLSPCACQNSKNLKMDKPSYSFTSGHLSCKCTAQVSESHFCCIKQNGGLGKEGYVISIQNQETLWLLVICALSVIEQTSLHEILAENVGRKILEVKQSVLRFRN